MTTEESKVKYLKNEITAFESRLAGVKSDLDSLKKQKESLMKDIEEAKARHNRDVEEKHTAIRQSTVLVDASRTKLETDKKEFEGILKTFQQEKAALGREKQEALDMKANAQKDLERVGVFIRLVRDGASKL